MPYSNSPPTLPEVYDEAADSPSWLPALGLGLVVLLALILGARSMAHKPLPRTAAPAHQVPENISPSPLPDSTLHPSS